MRNLKNQLYPFYCTSELAEMCGASYEQMRRLLKQTPLWKQGFGGKVKRQFWLTDIQNTVPQLWDSIMLKDRINGSEDEEEQDLNATIAQFR